MYIGDFTPGKTVVKRFNSHDAAGTPATLSGTPAISVYKAGSTTESTTGVSLTVDYDGRTGLNYVAIDTGADGTFYASGSDFDLVITTGTVDSISVVGSVVGTFSLSNRAALRPTVADRTLDVSSGGEAGVDWANVGSPTTTVNLTGTTAKADLTQVGGTNIPTANVAGALVVDIGYVSGTAASTETGDLATGTAQAGAAGSITLASGASSTTDLYKGARVVIRSGTGAGQAPRTITAYNGTTKVATVDWNWITTPDNTSVYALQSATGPAINSSLQVATTSSDPWGTALPGAYGAGTAGYLIGTNLDATVGSRLAPTVASRTLDVSATGEAGVDWANIGSPTTTVNFSGTTVGTVTTTGTATAVTMVNGLASGVIATATFATGATIPRVTLADTVTALGAQAKLDVNAEADTALADVGLTTTITGRIDAAISTRLATSSYTAPTTPPTAIAIRQEMDSNSIKLANLDVTVSSRLATSSYAAPDNATITAIAGYLDTEVAAIKLVTDHVATALESDGLSGYQFTTLALENAPSGGGGGTDWTNTERSQIRHRLGIDGTAAAPSATPSLSTVTTAQVNTEVDTALADVGLTTTITGRIDTTIGSRLATSGYTAAPTTVAIRQEIDSNSTQLAAISGYIDTEVASIYSRLGAPAGASLAADIAAISSCVDSEVTAIKAKTDQLTFTTTGRLDASVIDKTGFVLAAAGLDSVTIEPGTNARQALSGIAATCLGTASGMDTNTPIFKGVGVSTTRVSATTDSSGNRASVTLSPPA